MTNLPPGVTDAMIDEYYRGCLDDCEAYDADGNFLPDECECEARREEWEEARAIAAHEYALDYFDEGGRP
jgi:hypothetical protein